MRAQGLKASIGHSSKHAENTVSYVGAETSVDRTAHMMAIYTQRMSLNYEEFS